MSVKNNAVTESQKQESHLTHSAQKKTKLFLPARNKSQTQHLYTSTENADILFDM